MKITQEELLALDEKAFKVIHYFLILEETEIIIKGLFDEYSKISQVLCMSKDDIIKSFDKLRDLGYISQYNGVAFLNDLEIV